MARSIKAFLKAMEAALTASALMGPVTNWSINSLGIRGRAADLAAMAAFFNFVLLGINAPIGHVMPQTQNSGQAHLGLRNGSHAQPDKNRNAVYLFHLLSPDFASTGINPMVIATAFATN